jgi:CubicO group peptidase (beta-lactamase class C family)
LLIMIELDGLLTQINRRYGRPALVGGVSDRDGLVAAGATGVRRVGASAPVRLTDPFHIGSVTKAISATVLARLVDEGALAWRTTTADVFGDGGLDPTLARADIDALLAHRGGLAAYTEDEEWTPFAGRSGPATEQRAAFAAYVLGHPPAVAPGEMNYSNAGYTVAAAMAERVTGECWEDLIRTRVFEPLGLASAGFGWPGAGGGATATSASLDATATHATTATHARTHAVTAGPTAAGQPAFPYGHTESDGGFQPEPPDGPYQLGPLLGPAGDLHMNLADLAAFGRVHVRGIAGEDTIATAAQIRALYESMGSFARSAQRAAYVGSAGTFTAVLALRPYAGQVVVLMTNGGDAELRLASDVQTAVLAHVETAAAGTPT